jgi:CRP-like cAMP-binding protein
MTDLSPRIAEKHGRPCAAGQAARDDPLVARLQSFVALTRADLDSFYATMEAEQPIKKRRDLVLDGYEFCKLGFIKDGFAARYKLLRNGKRQIINFLLPGDMVGMPGSFLDRAPNSVIAISDMTLQVCALSAFVALCGRQPKFALALSWLAAQEAAIYAEHIIDIGRRSPLERLAHFLLEIHSRLNGVGRADDAGFDLPFTQEMMSDALGLSVPHLNRTLARLRAEGLIAVNERRVEFSDAKALALLAQFQPIHPTPIPFAADD